MAMRKVRRSIADLPDSIIHHILSLLSTEQAAKTSVLCKAWLSAWRTRPILEFNYDKFFPKKLKKEPYDWRRDEEESKKRCINFVKYIKTTLKMYQKEKIGIDTINLNLSDYFDWDSLVKRCMRVAAENGVKKLYLSALLRTELPEVVFEARSLVDLSLWGVTLNQQSPKKIRRFDRLKRLSLHLVDMHEDLISCCQSIEILEIYLCRNDYESDQNFKVAGLNNLKELTVRLYVDQRLNLCEAPSLESLICKNGEAYLHLEDSEWLCCGFNLHSSQYGNLKTLLLYAIDINDHFFTKFAHKFPHLEYLSIEYCTDLKRIKISSRSLKIIQLVDSYGLKEAQFDVPSIVKFDYYDNDCMIIPELSFTAASGHWSSSISICWFEEANTSWFLKLKGLLASLIQSEISLNLEFQGSIDFDFNEITDDVTFHEPQEVQELSLSIDWEFPVSSTLSVSDVCFWICRPKTIMECWDDGEFKDNGGLKFLYEMLMLGINQEQVHNSQQIKFWQNDLREVKLEMFERDTFWLGNTKKFIAVGQGEQLPEALDWENFLNVLRTQSTKEMMIAFKLDWRPSPRKNEDKKGQKDRFGNWLD